MQGQLHIGMLHNWWGVLVEVRGVVVDAARFPVQVVQLTWRSLTTLPMNVAARQSGFALNRAKADSYGVTGRSFRTTKFRGVQLPNFVRFGAGGRYTVVKRIELRGGDQERICVCRWSTRWRD